MNSLIKYWRTYIKRVTLIAANPIFLLLILFNDSFAQENPSLKPISTLNCQDYERIIFEVYNVENPYIIGVVKMKWMGLFNNIMSAMYAGMAAGTAASHGGNAAVIYNSQPILDDLTDEFKQSIISALTKIDLQKLFIKILENNLKSKTAYL